MNRQRCRVYPGCKRSSIRPQAERRRIQAEFLCRYLLKRRNAHRAYLKQVSHARACIPKG